MNSPETIGDGGPRTRARRALNRRKFVRHFALGLAGGVMGGGGAWQRVLAVCEPAAEGTAVLRLRVSDHPALARANGSVRLAFHAFQDAGPLGPFFPMLINRGFGTQFHAMSTRCPHRACVVRPFEVARGASVCPCHGSRFGLDGTRLSGPAPEGLATFPVSYDGVDGLCVELPEPALRFRVTVAPAEPAWGRGVLLEFPTVAGVRYEVRRQRRLEEPGEVVAFQLSPEGPTLGELEGDGGTARLYVAGEGLAAAFLSVAVKVQEG